jgi:hypothetical protein
MFETAVHLMLGGDVGNKKYTYTFNYCITNHVQKRPHGQNSSIIANWMIVYARFEVNVMMNLLLWFLLSNVLLAVY